MKTILVVEDDQMNREMICRILQWQGYAVITAGDGLQACELADSARPDLILMDMGLPMLTLKFRAKFGGDQTLCPGLHR